MSDREDDEQMERRTLSATTLIKDKVQNLDGEGLGSVKDLMIDLDGGTVAYAVVDFGGFLGIGGKLFAVPWAALTLNSGSHELILDMDRERLENAPGFDPDHWPDFSDRDWGEKVYEHYGVRPHWDE